IGEKQAAIFDAHLLVLEDPELLEATEAKIKGEKLNAELAFSQVSQSFISMFESMSNEMFRARAVDVRDVSQRVLRQLLGITQLDLSSLSEDVILVAHDLTPSQTATMDRHHVLGFITAVGGKTSHTAILARTLEIPAVTGIGSAIDILHDDQIVALDGNSGEVTVSPSMNLIERFKERAEAIKKRREALQALVGKPSRTFDGHTVRLEGNIGNSAHVALLKKNDAEGIGLYRTEFLFLDREAAPTEEEQFAAYKFALESLKPHPVIIRTIDIGGDKDVPYLKMDKEANPFLGNRAIRLCLRDRKDAFRTQLRALLRAAPFGDLGIMFPMISGLTELLEAKAVVTEVRNALTREGFTPPQTIR
ncbi:MAG: phosphoenolpyruvate--protein phosphotransferase, partial [Bdellovibrionota bacterium]